MLKNIEYPARPSGIGLKLGLMLMATMQLAACDTKADDQLLASDLVYLKQQHGWKKTLKIDSWLTFHPDLVRHLRSERVRTMEEGRWDCRFDDGCFETSDFRLAYDGTRLVSIVEEHTLHGGGAHPITGVTDYLYDLEAHERIRFGDLFTSWSKARPLIQEAFCTSLQWDYEDVEKCPDVQQQAISLASMEETDKAPGFTVETQDYALGYYAAGRATIYIQVNQQILAVIKPEYRSQFEDPDRL